MKTFPYYIKIFIIVLSSLVLGTLISSRTDALTAKGAILDKAVLEDVYWCYTNGIIKQNVGEINDTSFSSFNNLITSSDQAKIVKLPNGLTDVEENAIKCEELFTGKQSTFGTVKFEGLLNTAKRTIPDIHSSVADRATFLKNVMGYNETSGAAGGKCFSFKYWTKTEVTTIWTTTSGPFEAYSDDVCANSVNGSDIIGDDKLEIKETGTLNEFIEFKADEAGKLDISCTLNVFGDGGCLEHSFTKGTTKWTDFRNEVYADIAAHASSKTKFFTSGGGGLFVTTTTYSTYIDSTNPIKDTTTGAIGASYKIDDFAASAKTAMNNLSNDAYKGAGLAYSVPELIELYNHYLRNWYTADLKCDLTADQIVLVKDTHTEWNVGSKKCYIQALGAHASESVHGLTNDTTLTDMHFSQERTFQEVLAALTKVAGTDSKYVEQIVSGVTTDPADPDGDPTTDDASTCNVEHIGWIICPVVKFLASIADKAYGFIAKDFLVLDSGLLGKNESGVESSAKIAWKSVQGVANTAFIIAFLIIIFSQITSLGISNYGIKKMLPKLIIAAILVNLSYYICQIAVDISNIIGTSINSYINGFTAQLPNSIAEWAANDVDGYMPAALPASATGKGMAGIAGLVLVGAGIAIFASLATLIPILLGAVVACVTILFILVLRKALIIMLAVISPLAFVAYMLPNTQKLFDKWQKSFVSLLMVYPIVAFVFAGSKLASAILMPAPPNGTDPVTNEYMIKQIIASGVAVLPLFIIPGLLKKSLDGIAGIGAMVNKASAGASGLGKKGTAAVQKKYADSDFGKFRTARKADIKARTKAGNYTGKNPFRKVQSRAYEGANKNRVFNAATGGFGANKDFAMAKQSKADEKEFTEMTADNEDLIMAISNDGFNENSDAFKGLSKENQTQMRKMKAIGLDRKASTYLASAKYLGDNGKGSGAQIDTLVQSAKKHGAKENTTDNAYGAAISGFKKNGRADAVASTTNLQAKEKYRQAHKGSDAGYTDIDLNAAMKDAFKNMPTTALNKRAFKTDEDYDTTISDAENNKLGRFSEAQKTRNYTEMLFANDDKLNEAVQKHQDIADSEAQGKAIAAMLPVAQSLANRRAAATGTVAPRFADAQEAKNYLSKPQP